MSIIMQEFDFSKQMISATSKHIALQPGDKVIWRKSNRRMYGVSFDIKCTVVKASAKSVKVLCRWKGRTTGEIRTEERSVPIRCLFRYDWNEVPQAVNEKIQATVLAEVKRLTEAELMGNDLSAIQAARKCATCDGSGDCQSCKGKGCGSCSGLGICSDCCGAGWVNSLGQYAAFSDPALSQVNGRMEEEPGYFESTQPYNY